MKYIVMCKVYTDVGGIKQLYHVCLPVRKIIHSLKLVDYLHVHADNPWYNYYIDFFFGRYDIIADVINHADKEELYCYIARFIHLLKKKLHPALVAFPVCLMGIWPRDPLH